MTRRDSQQPASSGARGRGRLADIARSSCRSARPPTIASQFQAELDKIAATTSAGPISASRRSRGISTAACNCSPTRSCIRPSIRKRLPSFRSKPSARSRRSDVARPSDRCRAQQGALSRRRSDRSFASPQSAGASRWTSQGLVRRGVSSRPDDDRRHRRRHPSSPAVVANTSAVGRQPDRNRTSIRRPRRPTAAASSGSGQRPRAVVGAARRIDDVRRTDPAWAPLQVANTVLTGGFYSSLLYHDLREVHGYAYSVGAPFVPEKCARAST